MKNVLRLKPGDFIRLFNGRDGEWLGEIASLDKKEALIQLQEQTKPQPTESGSVHLLLAPIKKQRLDFLIEKAIELRVTDLHPVLTGRTQVRKINAERIRAQITEAAEQCERLEIPTLHELTKLPDKLAAWDQKIPIIAALEYFDAPHISQIELGNDKAFLIGPEGGFEDEEKDLITGFDFVQPASLGESLLRAETAALKCLSLIDRKT